jgi:NNP family nitrate/nitrite transporter-like MFS transporter
LFTAAFVFLIAVSGLGNGSTYAMIPVPYAAAATRAISAGSEAAGERLAARRKAGAVIAIAGTAGGLGGVAINLAFRQSYQAAHTARPALIGFLGFYAACLTVTALAARRQAQQAEAATARVTAGAAA